MPDQTYRFLVACIRGDRERIQQLLATDEWDWNSAIRIASDEGLLPAIYEHRLAFSSAAREIVQFLSEVEASNRERNSMIGQEIRHAVSLLNRKSIEPVLLKGAAYPAAGVYGNPAARYLGDIDLLIPTHQMHAAIDALKEAEYQVDDQDPFGTYRHHYPPLSRPGHPPVELHHSLGLGICARLLPAAEVIEHSSPRDLGGVTARLPCPEHLVIHLVMHSQLLHAYTERIWPPLRAMSDLFALHSRYGKTLDWDAIGNRFRRFGLLGVLTLHLRQVEESLGVATFSRCRLTPSTRLRWMRRQFLRRFPTFRYADPIYMTATILGRRLLMLRNVVKTPTGRKHLAARIATPDIYSRFWTDLLEGRGR